MPVELVDFSSSALNPRFDYGGSDRKSGIIFRGVPYMVKYTEKGVRKNDLATSYVNNVISEYVGSHIVETLEIPVHETLLGEMDGALVVACRDFRQEGDVSQEFSVYLRRHYDSSDIGRVPEYHQVMEVFSTDPSLAPLFEENVGRFWETFVVDALLGNFDRHKGNWGYIVDIHNEVRLAPIYDLGSTLFPALSEDGMVQVLNDNYELEKRVHLFPKAALTVGGKAKVRFEDALCSGFDENCVSAVLRIVPRINLNVINSVIRSCPVISEIRKEFYFQIVRARYEQILIPAYWRCRYREFDELAINRISNDSPYSESDFDSDYKAGIYGPSCDGLNLLLDAEELEEL